jgi:hypothetical protein
MLIGEKTQHLQWSRLDSLLLTVPRETEQVFLFIVRMRPDLQAKGSKVHFSHSEMLAEFSSAVSRSCVLISGKTLQFSLSQNHMVLQESTHHGTLG